MHRFPPTMNPPASTEGSAARDNARWCVRKLHRIAYRPPCRHAACAPWWRYDDAWTPEGGISELRTHSVVRAPTDDALLKFQVTPPVGAFTNYWIQSAAIQELHAHAVANRSDGREPERRRRGETRSEPEAETHGLLNKTECRSRSTQSHISVSSAAQTRSAPAWIEISHAVARRGRRRRAGRRPARRGC